MLPLEGIKVIELAGLAPGPFAGMILADFGAKVIRVDKITNYSSDVLSRGKRSISIDLKTEYGINILKRLIGFADVLIDPFRPGVLEALGLAPTDLLIQNPKLIIARMTGFGQSGKYKKFAGHDINYIALSGILSLFGPADSPPAIPCNIIGDFAGGGAFCALGIILALFERTKSNCGQIIDASMIDGSLYLATFIIKMKQLGVWNNKRGNNLLDGGAPFYKIYPTLDNKFIAVGAIEPQFYRNLLYGLSLDKTKLPDQNDTERWGELELIFSKTIKTKTRDEWMTIFENLDACVTPILEMDELSQHAHHASRGVWTNEGDPIPAPRLSRTPAVANAINPAVGEHTIEIIKELEELEKSKL